MPVKDPANIALRDGAIRPTFSVPGGTIPASSATRVAVTLTSGEATFKSDSASFSNISNYVGRFRDIDVSLRQRDEYGWTIARLACGAAVTVPADSWPFATVAARTHRDDISIFWAGRNNTNSLASWTQKMVDNLVGSRKRFLELGVITGRGNGRGSRVRLCVGRKRHAGHRIRGELSRHAPPPVDNGRTQAGITPTTQDVADKAADTTTADSTAETPYTAGVLPGTRVDVGAVARTVTFYTSPDGVTWT